LGGAVIQDYYFKFPNEVSGLILVGSGGRLRVSPTILETIKIDYQYFLNTILIGSFYTKTPKKIINDIMRETSKVKAEVTYNDFYICDNFDTLHKTSTIQVPCLIICGEEDVLTPVKYSQFFHDKLKTSELCIIKEAGHMVMVEKPQEVNTAIMDFISNYY
jgi:pimeloyl-ACP methyl ester carboxylesterase